MYDVVVIGAGVVGGMVLRELSRYDLKILMLEKQSDVSMGQSRANSGIVHAGYDAKPNTLKAKFNLLGNLMMEQTANELGVKFKNNGSLVVAFCDEEKIVLEELLNRGEQNGVKGLKIISKEQLMQLEPNISQNAIAALHAPTGGIVCPYELTVASIGNAMDNGANLICDFEVCDVKKTQNGYQIKSTDQKTINAKCVINCAGIASGKIANLVGDDIQIGGRRGEYILLDRESGDFVSHTLFFAPTKKGKGILIAPTVDNNILLGPTAVEVDDGNTETTVEGFAEIIEKANTMCKNVPYYNTITSFAGTRSYSIQHDFIIEESKNATGFIHCAGIESPGLTAAPAIGKYVVENLVSKHFNLVEKANFNPIRKPDYFFKNLSIKQKNEVIKNNKAYGKIICRCEQITEGEIVRAIHENPPATNVDAIKRRTRAGMGRCQGGFCQPLVAEIIARELNIPLEQVTKSGKNSYLLRGKTK